MKWLVSVYFSSLAVKNQMFGSLVEGQRLFAVTTFSHGFLRRSLCVPCLCHVISHRKRQQRYTVHKTNVNFIII